MWKEGEKMKKRYLSLMLGFTGLLIWPALAWAGDSPTPESNAVAIDTVWVLLAAFLVFFMQPGFALVEAGFIRAKNAANIIMKNVMDFASGSLIYWLVGFGIMFGIDKGGLFGTTGFAMTDDFAHLGLSIPVWAFLIFQTMFAATAATIVSGAMAERTKFVSYLLYTLLITAVVYPVVGHWAWGQGWLAQIGFIDFAGSTVVHSVGGWAGLVGAYLVGPRLGKYEPDGRINAIPGHNIILAALGVFILWFGWFGFNPGSTLAGTDASIASVAVNTNLSAAAGAVAAMLFTWWRYGKPDVSLTLNGALAGLVAITAGCASVSAGASIIIGIAAGILVVISVEFIDRVLKIDDPVGAVSAHAVCGAFGTLMVGFFALDGGLFYNGGPALLLTQLIGVVTVFAWVVIASFIIFGSIKAVLGLRVSEEQEIMGLDIYEHGMEAYGDVTVKD